MKPSKKAIPAAMIDGIESALSQGMPIRQQLPLGGILNIDRSLPFLIVYRKSSKVADPGTDTLISGEASYLIASADPGHAPSLSKLVRTIAKVLSGKCQSFLIIELWSNEHIKATFSVGKPIPPSFRIVTSASRPPTHTVEALKEALK